MATMTKLEQIKNVLHDDFLCKERTVLEEKTVEMKISIDSNGCNFLLYKYDKELKKEYRGGLFPFFAKNRGVCSVCDYILFAEVGKKLFILIIELKKGNEQTLPQLKAACCFVNYIMGTINRVNRTSIEPEIRLISIHEYNVVKKSTREKGINYDSDCHCQFKQRKFQIKKFLI